MPTENNKKSKAKQKTKPKPKAQAKSKGSRSSGASSASSAKTSSQPAPVAAARPYDLVLFGATGFTGGLVAEYLAGRAQDGSGSGAKTQPLRWAIAGRRQQALQALAKRFGNADNAPGVIVADASSRADMEKLAQSTRAVCSTVGPYTLYGSELVRACAHAGTHYCDLTGEVPWIRQMTVEHGATASETGARIVHACGFDSLPFDLGVYMLQQHAIATHGRPCSFVRGAMVKMRGSFSGGTVASMLTIADAARQDATVRQMLADPYGLCPNDRGMGLDRGDAVLPKWDEDYGWTGPFVMSAVNTRVVRRTNAQLGFAYGDDFRYREFFVCGRGARGLAGATALSVGLQAAVGVAVGSSMVPAIRSLLEQYVLPGPGDGPSAAQRQSGHFTVEFRGRGRHSDGTPFEARARCSGNRDPGYGATAGMLGACAVGLAQLEPNPSGSASRSAALGPQAGSLTPAVCFGDQLLEPLAAAGIHLDVDAGD